MGTKRIWDGADLPPEGSEVRIHLASENKWIRHVVTGYTIKGSITEGDRFNHRIFINVGPSDDKRSSDNSRLLMDARPVDWCETDAGGPQ